MPPKEVHHSATPNKGSPTAPDLRREAEIRLSEQGKNRLVLPGAERDEILHELQVHQIELEMQNEELRRTHEALEEARARYFDLFELAPVAYLTLDGDGLLLEANLGLSKLLGLPRAVLLRQPLTRFIAPEGQDHYYQRNKQPRDVGALETYELPLAHAEDKTVWVDVCAKREDHPNGAGPITRMTLVDISDRKQVELLRQREADERVEGDRQRTAILDSLPAHVALLDENGLIVAVNNVWRRFAADNEMADGGTGVGQNYLDICEGAHGECSEGAREAAAGIRAVLSGGSNNYTLEYPCHSPDKRRWFRLMVAPLGTQERAGAVVIHVDVSERVQAEEMARSSEARYRVLLESIPQNIVSKDRKSRFLACNQNFARKLGTTAEEIPGKTDFDYFPKELAEKYRADDKRVMETGEAEEFDENFFEHGEESWIHKLKAPIRDDAGHVVGVLVSFWDTTEVHLAQEKIALQAAVMEAAANGIVITDVQGTIEWANPAFAAITGFSVEEAVGKNPRELMRSGLHEAAFFRNLWETVLAGLVWQGEITNRRKDGTLYTEMQTITPVRDSAGAIKHFVAVKVDITERKKLEQELVQAQKMESVGRLAGGVAHDFNNLLTIISGYTEMALLHVKEDDHLHADLTQVYKAAERAASLTRQLLAFSRRQVLRPEILDLNHTLGDCTKMLQRLIGEDVAFVVKPCEGLWPVLADPGQIEQIIMNLVVNARDAMPLGGSVIVETQNVDLDDDIRVRHNKMQSGRYVCLAVSDTGTGMDAATQKQIFEPFFTTKGVGKGTGLGLATVYGIVKQSGGSIFVYSELGKGTTFKIYLPRAVVDEPTQRIDPGKAVIPRGAETILLVKDEEPLRVLAERILTQAGYTVFSASNGVEALALVEREHAPIHLVLTDVIMPEMGGRELVNRLTEKHPGFKILYMSGYTDTAIAAHGVLDGGTQLLGKPFTALQLTCKVREVLDE